MARALALAAEAATRDEVPVGAVLVREDLIIGEGSNRREETHRTVAHAEIEALEDYSRRTGEWRLPPGTSLYVTAEPCLMCTGALIWARVENIYYGCSDPRGAGLLRIWPLIQQGVYDHRFQKVESGILEAECAEVLKAYFRAKRR
jgi:tRNA(adenine34) deaminase